MTFSACWYPTQHLDSWKLDGAEIIIEKPLIPVYEKMVEHGLFLTVHSPMSVVIGSVKKSVRLQKQFVDNSRCSVKSSQIRRLVS